MNDMVDAETIAAALGWVKASVLKRAAAELIWSPV